MNDAKPKMIETWLVPERLDFICPQCQQPCILFPRGEPMAAVHAMPTCSEWTRIELKQRPLADFLKDAGVKMFGGEASS